jgi:hypothetical protein
MYWCRKPTLQECTELRTTPQQFRRKSHEAAGILQGPFKPEQPTKLQLHDQLVSERNMRGPAGLQQNGKRKIGTKTCMETGNQHRGSTNGATAATEPTSRVRRSLQRGSQMFRENVVSCPLWSRKLLTAAWTKELRKNATTSRQITAVS